MGSSTGRTVFELGRMRHLDLLALVVSTLPHGGEQAALGLARLSKEQLVRWLLAGKEVGNAVEHP